MRLFLSSYRFGGHEQRLLDLCRGRRAAVIANACDSWPSSMRSSAVTSDIVPLQRLGFTVREIDLRTATSADFNDLDLLWVRGGNTFVLRAQFALSGADTIVREKLAEDAFVYAGYSAGACLATPTLLGLDAADPLGEVLPTTGIEPQFDGLGLVDYAIVPHWESPELDEAGAEVVGALTRAGVPYKTLRDDEVIVVS